MRILWEEKTRTEELYLSLMLLMDFNVLQEIWHMIVPLKIKIFLWHLNMLCYLQRIILAKRNWKRVRFIASVVSLKRFNIFECHHDRFYGKRVIWCLASNNQQAIYICSIVGLKWEATNRITYYWLGLLLFAGQFGSQGTILSLTWSLETFFVGSLQENTPTSILGSLTAHGWL